MDPKTGIHEPTEPMVKIPEWMVINSLPILYQDGIHDDTAAVQAMIDGKPYQLTSGKIIIPASEKLKEHLSKDES